MLKTPFETIERGTRAQLAGALAQGGFDPARDILGITTNRWAHGYASFYFSRDGGVTPNQIGRKRFGRIAIANSDAGARAVIHSAIDQAYRAVGELVA
jgi:spermidine dehydrogenase